MSVDAEAEPMAVDPTAHDGDDEEEGMDLIVQEDANATQEQIAAAVAEVSETPADPVPELEPTPKLPSDEEGESEVAGKPAAAASSSKQPKTSESAAEDADDDEPEEEAEPKRKVAKPTRRKPAAKSTASAPTPPTASTRQPRASAVAATAAITNKPSTGPATKKNAETKNAVPTTKKNAEPKNSGPTTKKTATTNAEPKNAGPATKKITAAAAKKTPAKAAPTPAAKSAKSAPVPKKAAQSPKKSVSPPKKAPAPTKAPAKAAKTKKIPAKTATKSKTSSESHDDAEDVEMASESETDEEIKPKTKAAAKKPAAKVVEKPTTTRKRRPSAQEPNGAAAPPKRSHQRAPTPVFVVEPLSTLGDRVLTCGEGEQLGHPGRTTTKKPRAIDTLPDGVKIVQVVAGGVHTLVLLENGKVFSCGINEGGTVPVTGLELDGTTDQLADIEISPEISELGPIVRLAAGAGFVAALTQNGSVVAWGNLRDDNGAVEVHHLFAAMRKGPTVILRAGEVKIIQIATGENHLAMLSSDGEVYTFGEGSHGQLGNTVRKAVRSGFADDTGKSLRRTVLNKGRFVKFDRIFASGYWTAAQAVNKGGVYVCGLNNYGQLGIPLGVEPTEDAEDLEAQNAKLKVPFLTRSPAFDANESWTHIAGVKHIVARSESGTVIGLGVNTDNEIGIGTFSKETKNENWRYTEAQKIEFPGNVKIAGVDATLGASIAWDEEGKAYGWGYDSVGQLGLGNLEDEEKCVTRPHLIESKHLEGFKIVQVSLADNHAVFLASKVDKKEED